MADYKNSANQNDRLGPREKDNVVRIPTLAERARAEKERTRLNTPREPIINMPPVTKYALGVLIGIQIINAFVLTPAQSDTLIETLGFTPTHFSPENFKPLTALTPFTYMFLHGSWMHLGVNAFMLAAFGSGIERWLGARRMVMLFVISALCGALLHYGLNTPSSSPMIGASGGISGLFAAALTMINRGGREMGGRFGILPFALLWIGLSIGFGMIGGPDGSSIAWAAHVGGFLGGLVVLRLMRV